MQWLGLIQSAVGSMDCFLKRNSWHGRENEVVNLFAHRFLAEHISPEGPLRSLRQVGIEVAVLQVTDSKKQFVRKDLVIWPCEDMTVWTGDGSPTVIMEWKRNNLSECERDSKWLKAFCSTYPQTLGVSVCALLLPNGRGCKIVSVHGNAAA